MGNNVKGFYNERPVYYGFIVRKDCGEQLSVVELTYDIMTTLWSDEMVGDFDIARLFDTKASFIRGLRQLYGINHASCIKMHLNEAKEVLGNLGASIMMA